MMQKCKKQPQHPIPRIIATGERETGATVTSQTGRWNVWVQEDKRLMRMGREGCRSLNGFTRKEW
ncbi:MAG: hypothetical protein EOM62_21975 [Bacteroidia bacterium]|nr:hypothetical protein [Bacteroidia bacterium]